MAREALHIDPRDNVAVALKQLSAQERVRVEMADGKAKEILLTADIPFGHKFALERIPAGSEVIKYGEVMGKATRDIEPGEHVHTHNVESLRGRGDKG
ncbi:MAG: UxaA family hydrolase [Bacillota bacterium]